MDNNFDFYQNNEKKETTGETKYTYNSNSGIEQENQFGFSSVNNTANAESSYTQSSNKASQYSSPYTNPYESASTNNSAYQSNYTVNSFSDKKKKKNGKKALAVASVFCALCLAGGGSFYAGAQYSINNIKNEQSAAVNTSVPNANTVAASNDSGEITSNITQVVDNAMPSMVSINTIVKQSMNDPYSFFYGYMFGDGYENNYETSASGSGIIIGQNDEELLIATNYHVVEDSSEIAAEFIDGESYTATVKGTASDSDLAVISVPIADISADTLSKIKVAVMGDSTKLKLGEPAIAIGNSLGYGQSVTVGYISATEREVQITDKTMTLIQTDAAINPGNSGGALLNIKGEVIGINSAKYSDTNVEGTGYAIPISDATPIINSLMNSTYTSEEDSPYLGIYGQDVPVSYQERLDWPAGVYVSQVEKNSPASLSGLEQGDIITAINGTKITSMDELQQFLAKCKVGDAVELSVTRSQNGKMTQGTLKATLIARSDVENNE